MYDARSHCNFPGGSYATVVDVVDDDEVVRVGSHACQVADVAQRHVKAVSAVNQRQVAAGDRRRPEVAWNGQHRVAEHEVEPVAELAA